MKLYQAVELLQQYGKTDDIENQFRTQLRTYQSYKVENRSIQERVLLERESFYRFRVTTGLVEMTEANIKFFLEKNFILHRYAGNTPYTCLRSVEHLRNHYQLLYRRAFDEIDFAFANDYSLKDFLAYQYVHTLHKERGKRDHLLEEIVENHPEKVSEVASILADYDAYQHGIVRPVETITSREINRPYVYEKKASAI